MRRSGRFFQSGLASLFMVFSGLEDAPVCYSSPTQCIVAFPLSSRGAEHVANQQPMPTLPSDLLMNLWAMTGRPGAKGKRCGSLAWLCSMHVGKPPGLVYLYPGKAGFTGLPPPSDSIIPHIAHHQIKHPPSNQSELFKIVTEWLLRVCVYCL